MPRIFDNIEERLLPALQETLKTSKRADFCIGYFNLRGWKALSEEVEHFAGGDGACCRLLVGMHRSESDELRRALRLDRGGERMDNGRANGLKKELAREFRDQLATGAPTDEDERALRRLGAQLRAGKVQVRLFLRHGLHAKLYLCHTGAFNAPVVGFVGSSNLTFSGLAGQGELNVDVLEHDAARKLAGWFEDRWNDRWCLDITDDLIGVLAESWAREEAIPPYHIYLKIAYHLAQDARLGLSEFSLPKDLRGVLFDYQVAAVKLAARHLTERGGVVIGDVVGLGKTLMATALARILEEGRGYETLVLCPKNLVGMWEDYVHRYGLRRCRVLSTSRVNERLMTSDEGLRRYRLVIIDESHNLRNREGRRYRLIREYVRRNESQCVLLTATPYNKTYLDLSSQLRLFLDDERDLGVRPEALIRELGEFEFARRFGDTSPRSLKAFEGSEHPDDWRELMRLFLVRRTRSFVKEHYALGDCAACAAELGPTDAACPTCGHERTAEVARVERRFLRLADGTKSYFPLRLPKTVTFSTSGAGDPYARLYADDVVEAIGGLHLPRYGLGQYVSPSPKEPPTPSESLTLEGLSRAGRRLMGFSRTNLFKRLESSGAAFVQSVERHALRNLVFVHALEQGLPLPIGPQDAVLLDPDHEDGDPSLFGESAELASSAGVGLTDVSGDGAGPTAALGSLGDEPTGDGALAVVPHPPRTEADLRAAAATAYAAYETEYVRRFKWLRAGLFRPALKKHLMEDARALVGLLERVGPWRAERDAKLAALARLITETHPTDKVLVFSQFADTVRYLHRALDARGVERVGAATGTTADPTALAHRFAPVANEKQGQIPPGSELRVLLATDVLSEGQNLQDAHVVVNFDLPWALIRLVQRAGRVDRIGQKAGAILCYSFLPAEGVEKIIRLRERVRRRLDENAEVVGSDERFFEDADAPAALADLYHERAGLLDGDDDREVDLSSQALSIWQAATRRDPALKKTIEEMPGVVYSTKAHAPTDAGPDGVLVYTKTTRVLPDGERQETDALAWVDGQGRSVTESPLAILKAAECEPDTPALPRRDDHHTQVRDAVELVHREGRHVGGALGKRTGAKFRAYERLKSFLDASPLFATDAAKRALQALYTHPLTVTATDTLNRQMRAGLADEGLLDLVVALHDDERLVTVHDGASAGEPQIICSLGLARP